MDGKRHRKLKGLAATLTVGLLALPSAQAALRTDARHAALLLKEKQVQVDARHQALLDRDARSVTSVSIAPTGADGFDWTDAGIGAAGALGLIAAGGASLVIGRKKLAQA